MPSLFPVNLSGRLPVFLSQAFLTLSFVNMLEHAHNHSQLALSVTLALLEGRSEANLSLAFNLTLLRKPTGKNTLSAVQCMYPHSLHELLCVGSGISATTEALTNMFGELVCIKDVRGVRSVALS